MRPAPVLVRGSVVQIQFMADMQLVAPNAVAMAVSTLIAICRRNFQVSFFIAQYLLVTFSPVD
jgi:hypothetical protein